MRSTSLCWTQRVDILCEASEGHAVDTVLHCEHSPETSEVENVPRVTIPRTVRGLAHPPSIRSIYFRCRLSVCLKVLLEWFTAIDARTERKFPPTVGHGPCI